tara:strand:+ start:11595 stop:12509 length:915 start_codon:yes stop_codon:yes gene_type:complete
MANLIGCSCATGNGNTGLPNCSEQFGVSIGLGIQNMVANDGTANVYDISTSIGTSFIDSILAADKSKRMYPITDIRNVDFPKEDTQYVTDNSGQKEEIREGIQSFTAEKWKVPAAYDLKLKQMKCNRNGTWGFTRAGVWGIRRGNVWSPVEVNAFAPSFQMQTAASPAKEMIAFDWNATVNAGELWMLSWADLGTTYEAMIGLMDANYAVTNAPVAGATTSVSYRITSDYGMGLTNVQTVDGLITASFTAFNVTTGLAIVITSATEVPDDDYDFVLPSQTATDVVRISLALSTGFEGTVTFVEP